MACCIGVQLVVDWLTAVVDWLAASGNKFTLDSAGSKTFDEFDFLCPETFARFATFIENPGLKALVSGCCCVKRRRRRGVCVLLLKQAAALCVADVQSIAV